MKEDRKKPWTFQSQFASKNLEEIVNKLSEKVYRKIDKGMDLIKEMEESEAWVIAKGELSFTAVSSDGVKFEIAIAHRGGIIGLLPSVSQDIGYQLLVTYPAEIYVTNKNELKNVLSDMKASVSYKSSLFSKSIHIPLSPMLGMDIHEKILYILEYLAVLEEKKSGRRVIKISPSKVNVLTGIKREVVSLALARLIKHGWISIIHGNIMVKKR